MSAAKQVVTSQRFRWRGVGASEEQRPRRSQLADPRVAFALGLAELAGDVLALQLELAQMRDVGEARGVPDLSCPGYSTATFQPP